MARDMQQRIRPLEFTLFAGLDVDKRRIAITVTDHERVLSSVQMAHSSQQVLNYLRKQWSDHKVALAYEVGPTGFGLYDDLKKAGYRCLVVAPSMVPTSPGLRVKTNRLDSKKLSMALRGGQLQSVHVPTEVYRELRHLVQLRDIHVREMTRSKLRMKALLLYEGIAFPGVDGTESWTRAVLQELATLECKESVRFKLDSLLATLAFHKKEAVAALKQIRKLSEKETELSGSIKYLCTIPGIGWITASHVVSRIGDWRLLHSPNQIAGFLGMVSSEHSTGDKVDRGSITRNGDSRLRNKLIQAAWTAIRKDAELAEFYQRIYNRHPRPIAARKAIVAVARKLTTRIYAVLKEQRPFESRPSSK